MVFEPSSRVHTTFTQILKWAWAYRSCCAIHGHGTSVDFEEKAWRSPGVKILEKKKGQIVLDQAFTFWEKQEAAAAASRGELRKSCTTETFSEKHPPPPPKKNQHNNVFTAHHFEAVANGFLLEFRQTFSSFPALSGAPKGGGGDYA